MNNEIELQSFRARVLKHKAKNKFDCIKYLFTREQILDLTPILLYSMLMEKLKIPESKNSYDAVRRWQQRFIKNASVEPSTGLRPIPQQSSPKVPEKTEKKEIIKLTYSEPKEIIDQPTINILKK